MIFWTRTDDGWAVNLDGTSAAQSFTVPRIEIRTSPRGWTCACHLGDGTSLLVPLGNPTTAAAAMRAGVEACLRAVGPRYEADLRALLGPPGTG
jgi:hypothetical protein